MLFDPKMHAPRMLREMPCANAGEAWSTLLAEIEHRMHDQGFGEGFQKLCPVHDAHASEYNFRLHEGEGLQFVSSIRFAGLSLAEPFVEILLSSQPMSEATISEMAACVKREYEIFKQRRIRYCSPDDLVILNGDPEDFAFFAENTSVIHASHKPERIDEVELRPAVALDFYPDLVNIYGTLKEGDSNELQPESLSSLETSLQQGLVYEAFIDGQWAGMMSAQRFTERFYSGVFVVEEVLDKRFRGQGYAPAMQRRFIDQLNGDQLVFGEILWWNERSRRTALRVGRKKCGTTFFHRIE